MTIWHFLIEAGFVLTGIAAVRMIYGDLTAPKSGLSDSLEADEEAAHG